MSKEYQSKASGQVKSPVKLQDQKKLEVPEEEKGAKRHCPGWASWTEPYTQVYHDNEVQIRFGTKMVGLLANNNRVAGVKVRDNDDSDCEDVMPDAVVLAVGHSARDIYYKLLEHGVHLSPKDFSVGFRVEHPQELINEIQYNKWASQVERGSGKIPVADYKVATNIIEGSNEYSAKQKQSGCYSFCMCPGGQIIPTSTNLDELCINGMSFSKRSSKWANAALVMTVSSHDLAPFVTEHGPLAGMAFQRSLEREASVMGGGNLVVPVQTIPDFLDDHLSGGVLPSSSYRLGVKEAPLHSLFSEGLTGMFKQALVNFNKQLPGFIDRRALLHAVETRTSSPVRIERDMETFECISGRGLYPIGEGAGYAGGIVSAAVDGLTAGLALAEQLGLSICPQGFGFDTLPTITEGNGSNAKAMLDSCSEHTVMKNGALSSHRAKWTIDAVRFPAVNGQVLWIITEQNN
ncbi:hypothetical protein L7F22_015895 [Adiantum nelumboides]|nr:hypothetical protein [Adiantum nelumboides]